MLFFVEVLMKSKKQRNPFRLFGDLTGFERALWAVSAIVVTLSFLLSPEKDMLSLAASLVGVTALIFVAKGYVFGQVLTVIFAVFYGIISFLFKYYGEMITYLFMTSPIAIFSVIEWLRHPYKDSNEVQVRKMKRGHVIIIFVLSGAVTVAFYFILRALGNANLLFSTISVTTSFLASSLAFMRSPWYALAYAANDVVLIVLWVLASISNPAYIPMIACFLAFLANDIYGFYNWRRMMRRQSRGKE